MTTSGALCVTGKLFNPNIEFRAKKKEEEEKKKNDEVGYR